MPGEIGAGSTSPTKPLDDSPSGSRREDQNQSQTEEATFAKQITRISAACARALPVALSRVGQVAVEDRLFGAVVVGPGLSRGAPEVFEVFEDFDHGSYPRSCWIGMAKRDVPSHAFSHATSPQLRWCLAVPGLELTSQ